METYEMRTMFTLNMEGLHLRLHQFQVLLAQQCPRLDAHFNNHSIHTAMYASQWYLTLFAYSFPISLVLRIWDLVFAEGAVETITRVAVAIMQKNEEILLEMDDFEQLMMYLSSRKLYEVAYGSDPESVIADTMALSTVITKQKMDSISENYHREIEQEKTRAQQVLAIRFGSSGNKSPTTPKKNKRDSWFPWSQQNVITPPIEEPQQQAERRNSNSSSSSSSDKQQQQQKEDRTIPLLHQQIEDLVTVLSQLQKENRQISEDLMAKQMREMDLLTERDLLLQRNANLEKNQSPVVVQQQPSPVESVDGDCNSNNEVVVVEQEEKLEMLQKQVEFRGFVDSLKMSGDFGALIAGALSTSETKQEESAATNEEQQQQQREITNAPSAAAATVTITTTNESNNNSGLDEVTSELVAIKLANFEMGLKYQNLCQEHENVLKTLNATTEGQTALANKIMSLQTTIESLQIDKEQLLEGREHLLQENEELVQKSLATKKTCADLQLEKLNLDNDCQRLTQRVKELEDQRREYLMPRGSFTEEVFAAHQTLFGNQQAPAMSRRHTLQSLPKSEENEYQAKYIESDLRCRELEKLLAETKFKLVEYETSANGGISGTSSPRGSLQQNRRPNSGIMHTKRSSLSMHVKVNTNSSVGNGPQSPPYTDSRESTDSLRSTTSSTSGQPQKRSSVYSRFLNALGTGPLTEEAQELTEETK